MKYRDLQIQTQREAPNNSRTEGFSFLVRAGYLTRENIPTRLGETALKHLLDLSGGESFLLHLLLPTIGNEYETFFPVASGNIALGHCPFCKYTERLELANFAKAALPREEKLPLETVATPDCNTIDSLAAFLGVAKEKTAKALMYTRTSDNKFVFAVVRGDMQLSEPKLTQLVGDVRAATPEEIARAGVVAGYASAVGLKEALIVADDLIPRSHNLIAGANEAGYHLRNTNYERDYSADIVTDLILTKEGDACINCGNPLSVLRAIRLASRAGFEFENILLSLAETHHDDKGLTIPHPAAPFDVHVLHLQGRELDTREIAEEIYGALQDAGYSALFDDRDERAGVKFNDADLIGCPIRVTVGEKGIQENLVELKPRKGRENQLVPIKDLIPRLDSLLR